MSTLTDQIAQLEAAITAQESLRVTVPAAIVDASIAALREQLAALKGSPAGLRLAGAAPAHRLGRLSDITLADLQTQLSAEFRAKARAGSWSQGERRRVTVVFADISGFTALSEAADPEVIRRLQHELFTELGRIIYQYEGFVEKFIGDAILAVFGAPVAHEDDPERALRAALAMRERMAVLSRRWTSDLETAISLHIGINTGSVVAGDIGAQLGENSIAYAVTGDTVNTASRLLAAAEPGQILVGRTTFRSTHLAFSFRALEPISVRNKREPVPIYELLRARPLPEKVRGLRELGRSFVGRDEVMSRLDQVTERLTRPAEATGTTVLITAEAGLGKSRLVAEWRQRCEHNIQWLEGRCFAHTSGLAYGPFLDMIRRFTGITDDDSEKRARKRLDRAIKSVLPDHPNAAAIFANLLGMELSSREQSILAKLPAREIRQRALTLCEAVCRRLLEKSPVVLFLEDMQWVDLSTIDLVKHLLPLTASEPLAIVIISRPDGDSPVHQLIETLSDDAYVERAMHISLEPLPGVCALEMVRDLLEVADPPRRLIELVASKAEGNPFFVEEVIRALIERGALKRNEDGTWSLTPLMDIVGESIPDTVQGLIMARIDRLPDETKQVIQQASVIGRTFLYRVLLEIADYSPSLDADLNHLERAELIREHTRQPEVEYVFRHALTQDMAYQSLLKSRRQELHRRTGEALERLFAGRLGEYYSILADHFQKGGAMEQSAEYYRRAAEHAARMFSPDARRNYLAALSALETRDDGDDTKRLRIDVTLALAREELLGGGKEGQSADLNESLERLKTALSLAEALTADGENSADMSREDQLHAWLAHAHSVVGNYPEVKEHVEKALARRREIPDPELAARVGQILRQQGQFRQAAAILTPAVGALEASGRWLEWVHANGTLAVSLAAMGQYEAGLERAKRGCSRAEKLQGLPLETAANNFLGFTYLMGGQWDDAYNIYRENFARAQRLHNPAGERAVSTLQCWCVPRRESIDRIAETLDNCGRHPLHEGLHAVFHAEMWLMHPDRDEAAQLDNAEREANNALNIALQRNDVFTEGLACRVLGHVRAKRNPRDPEALIYMRRSRELLDAGGCYVEAARTLVAWGIVERRAGDLNGNDRLVEAQRIFQAMHLKWETERVRSLLDQQ